MTRRILGGDAPRPVPTEADKPALHWALIPAAIDGPYDWSGAA